MENITPKNVREIMEGGRLWFIGDPTDRHTFNEQNIVFYELISLQGSAEILLKIVRLIAKDGGNKPIIWRTLPEIEEISEITFKLYMRYAFI